MGACVPQEILQYLCGILAVTMDYSNIGAILMMRREVVEVAVFRHVLSAEADARVLAQDFGESEGVCRPRHHLFCTCSLVHHLPFELHRKLRRR